MFRTCVVGRVVVWVEELLDREGAGEQRMLGNGVQKGLQPPLPLRDELPVHVSNELLGRKRESDATNLERDKKRFVFFSTGNACF